MAGPTATPSSFVRTPSTWAAQADDLLQRVARPGQLAPSSGSPAPHRSADELAGSRNALEEIVRRAAQVLGVLTQELGVAVGRRWMSW